MSILSGAIVKIIARHDTLRTWQSRGFCLHIAVSDGLSLYNYFNQSGNPTSHFYVRKNGATPAVKIGTPLSAYMADFEQYVDTKYQAPAQLQGNPTLISAETQGGVGSDLDRGWTGPQMERLAWILWQCHKIHGMPLTLMANSLPKTTGVGYHRLGVDPYRVSGGELWSNSYGKVCPGSARIKQIPAIVARAKVLAGATPPPPPPPTDDWEEIMALFSSKADFEESVAVGTEAGNANYWRRFFANEQGTGDAIYDDMRAGFLSIVNTVAGATDEVVAGKLDDLAAKVTENTAAVNRLAAAIEATLPKP